MTIKQIDVTVGEITRGYVNNDEQGVRGYGGQLDIRRLTNASSSTMRRNSKR